MTVCRIVATGFAVVYALALAIFATGALGLFGQERDPLSAVFLLPLGLPWILFLDGVGDSLRPWLAAGAPAVNLALVLLVCRAATSGRR